MYNAGLHVQNIYTPGYIILGGYCFCLFGGASWSSAIDVVHGNLAAPDMIRAAGALHPDVSVVRKARSSGRLDSFVRLSMSLVFGLKMHLASGIADA